ncbi:hypothetical protein V6N11_010102 [Hibiscus sabdariffa]|uniref:Uncharacterized protein n=1 Tax=Hibiscus sabdariffa TaxID=183260 RepID=A0ABR2PDN5_9ROSI
MPTRGRRRKVRFVNDGLGPSENGDGDGTRAASGRAAARFRFSSPFRVSGENGGKGKKPSFSTDPFGSWVTQPGPAS